jgi:hypothetical protein
VTLELIKSEIVTKHLDTNFQIIQADGDGGDSLNRMGVYGACWGFITGESDDIFEKGLHYNAQGLPPGRYCRNPDPAKWYSNMNNVTRDQMLPLESAWAILGMKDRARTHFKARAARLMLHFSHENDGKDAGPLKRKFPDVPTPTELGLIIRAGRFYYLKWFLYMFDLFLILDVLVFRKLTERNRWDFDNQLLPVVLASLRVYPTGLSEFAALMYAGTDARERLRHYHSLEKNGIPPLGELMVKAFLRMRWL